MPLDGLQLGHYRLLHLIGSGGMGEVYLAVDARLQRQVAIKVVRTEASGYSATSAAQETARLFLREAKAIAMLDHPHILPLFDYGEEHLNNTEYTYLVMPFRPEGSLVTWLRERSSSELLSTADVVYVVSQAASALQYAHDHQIIHQDVKPANFLIRNNAEKPSRPDLLLADFGVAKLSSATSSASHSSRGTPTYMAPEQWEGNPVPATDQYSLAVMVYELLTGRPPFEGSPMRMMYLHANTQPQPPSTVNPQLPSDIDTVLLHALAKNPAARFASIAAFGNAVQQALPNTDSPTIIKAIIPQTPRSPSLNELRATLAISESEARIGTSRTLTLPGGHEVQVSVPAGAYNGQVISLEYTDGTASDGSSTGRLILSISILPTREIPATPFFGFGETFTPGGSISDAAPTEAAVYASYSREGAQPTVGPTVYPPPMHQTGSNQRPGFSGSRVALLIGLILLILLVSVGLFYTTVNSQTVLHNAATAQANAAINQANNNATAQVIASTAQANSANAATAQANAATAQANAASAQDHANATATALAQASSNPTPPPNPPSSNPYPPHTGSLVLNDPLSNQDGNNWKDYANNVSECTFIGGAYHVRETQARYYANCFAALNFSDFALEVQMQIIQGDCGGLMFRADATLNRFYSYRVCQDGSYALYLYVDNTNTNAQLLTSGTSGSINTGTGATNVLAVVAQGSQITLYANGQHVDSANDSGASFGQVGVFAQELANTTEVIFMNVKIWA